MNFFERAAQTLLGGSSVALAPAPLTASSSGTSDVSFSSRRSNTISPQRDGDTDDDATDTEDDSGIADEHDMTARAKRFFPDLGISELAMTGNTDASSGATTLNSFLTYW